MNDAERLEELKRQEAELERQQEPETADQTTEPAPQPEPAPAQAASTAPAQPAEGPAKVETQPDPFERAKADLDAITKQLNTAQQRPAPTDSKQVAGQERELQRLRNEIGRLTATLKKAGYEPEDEPATQPDIEAVVEQRVSQAVEERLKPFIETQREEVAYVQASELQRKFPIFKTESSLREIANNPLHPERPKLDAINNIIAIQGQNPRYRQLTIAETYALLSNQNNMQQQIAAARQQGERTLLDNINRVQTKPVTLDATTGALPGPHKYLDQVKGKPGRVHAVAAELPPEQRLKELARLQSELDEVLEQEAVDAQY